LRKAFYHQAFFLVAQGTNYYGAGFYKHLINLHQHIRRNV
jgi:hypothetical protein